MTSESDSDLQRLIELSSQHEIKLDPIMLNLLSAYRDTIVRWNSRVRIVSRQDTNRVLSKHVFESLLLAKHLPGKEGRLADIAAGGGFPGIPTRILRPDLEVTLIEAARMKCLFLKDAVSSVGLQGCDVVHTRAEAHAEENAATFDITTSRAVATLDKVWSLACPFLKQGGTHLALKGPGEAEAELSPNGIEYEETKVDVESRSLAIVTIVKP